MTDIKQVTLFHTTTFHEAKALIGKSVMPVSRWTDKQAAYERAQCMNEVGRLPIIFSAEFDLNDTNLAKLPQDKENNPHNLVLYDYFQPVIIQPSNVFEHFYLGHQLGIAHDRINSYSTSENINIRILKPKRSD